MTQPADRGIKLLDVEHSLDEMAASTDRLLATVDGLDDVGLMEPSLLPGWSRAHVLTHIARNADGLANLAAWARTGEELPMYAGGRAGRDADIEAGVGRHIGDIRLDLNDSAERLLGAFAEFPVEGLTREVEFASGAVAVGGDLPMLRIREVEIHHVDLDRGYSPAHWSQPFVRRTLDQLAELFCADRDCPVGRLVATDSNHSWAVAAEGPTLTGTASALLAWLTGRSTGHGLAVSPEGGPVPPAPRWS